MKTRILSFFMVFCLISAMLPVSAMAEANTADEPKTTVTATIQHVLDGGGEETGQMTAQIEAYMTDPANKTRTVKPCDIIFLIEQSRFMNTQDGSGNSGDERAEILNAMERLLDGMPQPTTGGEHRVAIAGYGRIENPGIGDSYDPTLYPGTRPASNPSLNTGYYTCSNDGADGPAFHSQRGWTEWSSQGITDAAERAKALPKLPNGYLNESYEDVFMTFDDAARVIDIERMVPWYAGAARMDAGLAITEQLAKIAKDADASDADRNLIICVAASSLPYQNHGSYQELRPQAAIAAATMLKNEYGATIFGLGDFNKLTLQGEMNDPTLQRDNFNSTMAAICGNKDTTTGADYFKGLSQVHDINQALNELMTKIDASVGEGAAEELKIDVDKFTEIQGGGISSQYEFEWTEIKTNHHILPSGSIREVASVDYYRFTGYATNGEPQFETEPSRHTELNLADIGSGDSIQTALKILPIPPQGEGNPYGEKVVITISDPVCIDYEWAGRWKPTFAPPAHEHAARGTKHQPASPTQNSAPGSDLHLKFGGWYRLWNEAVDGDATGNETWTDGKNTYVKYTGTVFPAFGNDLHLYGRWLPEIHVSFHWVGSVIPDGEDGAPLAPPSELTFPLNENGEYHYKTEHPQADGYEFDGWYKDMACTQKYAEGGEVLTGNTDLYGRWTKLGTHTVTFKVVNGVWNESSAWYRSDNTTVDPDDSTIVRVKVPLRDGKGTLKPDWVPSISAETAAVPDDSAVVDADLSDPDDPVDETVPSEPVDEAGPSEPVDEAGPSEPVDEAGPSEPVDEAGPSEPVDEVGSGEPVDEAGSGEQVVATASNAPIDKSNPIETVGEAAPNEPIDEAEPSVVADRMPLPNEEVGLPPVQAPSIADEAGDMLPNSGYKAPGSWDVHPNTNAGGIVEGQNYIYTYTFPPQATYTVTYHWLSTENPDGVTLPQQATLTETESHTVAEVSPVEGWTFEGWYDATEWGPHDEKVTSVTYDSSKKNVDLYGKWMHEPCKVVFSPDYYGMPSRGDLLVDGSKLSSWICTVPYGARLGDVINALPAPISGSETSWFFKDWDMEEDNSDDLFYTNPEILDLTVRSDLTFIAQWWPVVTFDANGGAWSDQDTKKYVKVPAGTTGITPVAPPIYDGHTFLGWGDADGNPIDFKTESITENTGPKTFYARWAKNATVTFRIVNGTWSGGETENKTVTVVLYPQTDGPASGTLNASNVPQIMIPAPGYEDTTGHWDHEPNTQPNGITGDVTYTYLFGNSGGGEIGGGDPDKPVDPPDPDKPSPDPDKPIDPPDPDKPSGSPDPDKPIDPPDPDKPTAPTDPNSPSSPTNPAPEESNVPKLPQTGQHWRPVFLLLGGGILLILAGVFGKKRYHGKHLS